MPLDFSQERVFEAEHPVRHLVLKGDTRARQLIAMFSGFHLAGQAKYNYVNALDGTPAHRVYVLDDFGPRGCYYIGAGKDRFVERSIVAMLEDLLAELGLDRSQLVLTGSSKGGTAALYLGVRHGFRVVAAAPQSRIATYCVKESRAAAVARLIAGGLYDADFAWLDDIVFEAIRESEHRPPIELLTSAHDRHHDSHVVPLIAMLRELGYPLDVTMSDYLRHNEVGAAFTRLLRQRFAPRPGRLLGRVS
jgi:hypothetical protein